MRFACAKRTDNAELTGKPVNSALDFTGNNIARLGDFEAVKYQHP
ncbi:hypothetical protein CRENPOLYSF2_4260003 [Crenothrix polyspora]|uniref:Uncharacterized protein n=1 Tax=Crenothrix polyspora TaxID=360316 RepID=A0A1R4HEY9_9GAMM|nr:hypothetical protein CRENPOLYSF2_4260003 [Crenothrix polyspora]